MKKLRQFLLNPLTTTKTHEQEGLITCNDSSIDYGGDDDDDDDGTVVALMTILKISVIAAVEVLRRR